MESKDKLELAEQLLDNLYNRVFSDEARVLSLLNIPKVSTDALIDDMGNSMRYIGLSILKDQLQLGSLESGVETLIDNLELRSKKHMRSLASKFLEKNELSMSDLLRPGRHV